MNNKNLPNEQQWKLFVLLLAEIAKEKGITQNDIAEKTGFKQSHISRVFSLEYSPSLKNFIAIAGAIEVNFFFEDKEDKTELNVMFERAMEELGRRPDRLPKN